MLDHALGDNPSVDQQLAVIANSLSIHIVNERETKEETKLVLSELTKEVAAMRLLQREQNGNVALLRKDQNKHDDWHGDNDENIAKRVGSLERDKEFRDLAIKIALASLTVGMTIATFIQRLGILDSLF